MLQPRTLQPRTSAVSQLRQALAAPGLLRMPCCFDAFSARLVEQAGFPLTFMSGFAVSASRLALPDTGLISYGEMLDQGRQICQAVQLPVIGDADTGYGNAVNVQRTVLGYAAAGFAGLMIEDQVAPKRCGHTRGKEVVERDAAFERLAAALDAREQLRAHGQDLLIIARTDARASRGLGEAIARAQRFAEMGADVLFVEAPCNEQELQIIARDVPGHKMANLVEQGDTPVLPPSVLAALGFKIAAYPLTLLSAAARAMQNALLALQGEQHPCELLAFTDLQAIVGFPEYDATLRRLQPSTAPLAR
ncbi:isocitrate lyase/PEP mutase family protein [Permianibacter sp. IMCC34836]|nr:isocitrate lyase/PEP mutase family protein [Permianibacter fluminis]